MHSGGFLSLRFLVPTVAIDKVFIANNTLVIPDEVLSHRLSLIPIQVNPRLLDYLSDKYTHIRKNTIVFKLHIKCTKAYLARGQDTPQQSSSLRVSVKSDQMEWLPNGSEFIQYHDQPSVCSTSKQQTYTSFTCDQSSLPGFPRSKAQLVTPGIIIAKLGLGQVPTVAIDKVFIAHNISVIPDEVLSHRLSH